MRGEAIAVKELTLKALVENIPQVTAFIDAHLEAVGCPVKAQMQIDVAIDELFGNIAHYAYRDKAGDATVRFEYDAEARTVSIAFIDAGVAFDPLAKPDPNVTLSARDRPVGGLGIFLVKKTMDGIAYRRQGNKNILTITKRL